MASCPLCNTPITEDFGLIECSNCGAQLLVHMDGRVVYSGNDEAKPLEEEEAVSEEAFVADAPVEFDYNSNALANPELEPTVMKAPTPPPEEIPPPPPPFVGDLPEPEPTLSQAEFIPPEEEEPPPEPEAEPEPETAAEEPAPDFLDEEQPPEPEDVIATPPPDENLSDIAQFGNSDSSSGRDGSLRYNLFITGIDTSDVREHFREAITDRKLIWDTDQILRSIRNGEVRIANVSAAKAHIVVSRLRELPVRVSWEQHALAQS